MKGKSPDNTTCDWILCNHYDSWDKDTQILYLKSRLKFFIQSMVKQQSLYDAQNRMLRTLERERRDSQQELEKKNAKLMKMSQKLEKYQKELEATVKERTKKLEQKSLKLLEYARELTQSNIALDVLLKKKDKDLNIVVRELSDNLSDQILPDIVKLHEMSRNREQQSLISRVILKLQAGFADGCINNKNPWSTCLSQREATVAKIISEGKNCEEAAELLKVSVRTVNSHCYNIRKKLNVPQNTRLREYLNQVHS